MSNKGRGAPRALFKYGDGLFSLYELLEKPEVVNYLKWDGKKLSYKSLCERLRRGLHSGRVSQQAVMEYASLRETEVVTVSPIRPVTVPPPRRTKPVLKPVETTGSDGTSQSPCKMPEVSKVGEMPVLLPKTVDDVTRFLKKLSDKHNLNANDLVKQWNSTMKPWKKVLHTESQPMKDYIMRELREMGRDRGYRVFSLSKLELAEMLGIKLPPQPPMFKRRPKPKEYISISPSKVDSFVKPKPGESTKMDVLRYLGLLDDEKIDRHDILV